MKPPPIQMSARHIEWYVFKFNAFLAESDKDGMFKKKPSSGL